MSIIAIYFLLSFIVNISAVTIPFIENVFLKPFFDASLNVSVRLNSTCQQCLCDILNSENSTKYVALNCFTNATCQFFQTFPVAYQLQPFIGAELYFVQGVFPNASKCCMSNITELLARLQNAAPVIANLSFVPSVFGYDETTPNETAIIGRYGSLVYWFNPVSLIFIRNSLVQNISLSLGVHNNSIFAAIDSVPAVNVFDSQTSNLILHINHTILSKLRKYIFINNGQNMIVTAQNNQSLAIFNINSPTNYTFQQSIPVPFDVHGLANVNDTYLYVSSWSTKSIAAYNYQNLTWKYQPFNNATGSADGSHIAADECGRVWQIIRSFGLLIYDQSGVQIASWNMTLASNNTIYDLLFLDNYILLVTRRENKQIIRYDPQVFCS